MKENLLKRLQGPLHIDEQLAIESQLESIFFREHPEVTKDTYPSSFENWLEDNSETYDRY